jgi:transposase
MASIIKPKRCSEMSKRRRNYDAEFKREIAQVYLEGRRTAPSLAEELGLHVNTIYKWAEQFKGDPEHSFPGSGNLKPEEAELKRAQRRIKELEEEVEILKKATAYFAKNSR